MEPLTVLGGKGFVGSRYVTLTPNCIVNERNDYQVKSRNILYFISTIDNYNIFTDPYLDIDTNLTTLIRVLTSIKEEDRPFTTFNFISSWFVYGETEWPARESSPCNPKGFYSITKRAAEQLLISYCQTFGIHYRILRLANVAGSTDPKASKKKNAIVHMIKELKENRPIQLYENGNVYRDIIDIDDCVSAINLVLKYGTLNTVYNIGNGKPVLLGEFMKRARKILGSTSEIGSIDTPEFHKFVQVKSMYMNNDKLKELGYQPRYSLEETIWRIANGSQKTNI